MQLVKVYTRRVGIQNAVENIISAEDLSTEIEYKYTSQGYVVQNSTWLGEVKNASGDVVGYTIAFVFTKDEVPPAKSKKE